MKYKNFLWPNYIIGVVSDDTDTIGTCKINFDNKKITIAEWFVNPGYQHNGIGKELLRYTLKILKTELSGNIPGQIEYIWNGQYPYVEEWIIKNFDAHTIEDLVIRKYSCEDTWDNHRYSLNFDKFIKYFDL